MKHKELVLTSVSTLLIAVLFGQPGTPDPEFGNNGIVTTGFETYSDVASSMVIQPDGKIVIAGSCYIDTGLGYDFSLLRYNTNGSLDNGFGTGGKLLTDINGISESATAVCIQPDGKIITAGYVYNAGFQNDFTIVRYNPDGSLDNTFDSDGKLFVDFNLTSDFAEDVVVQSDNKIIVAGIIWISSSNQIIGLIRLNSDGTLDNNFGTGGRVTMGIGPDYSWAKAIAVQTDGKIVVTGLVGSSTNYDIVLVRFNSDGSIDNSFGSGGIVITDINVSSEVANSLVIQPDGKIIVAGKTSDPGFTYSDFAVIRYTPEGGMDNTFGSGGIVTTDISSGYASAESLVLQNDGKIVVAGSTDYDEALNSDFALVRYLPNGALDAGFGSGGIVNTDIAGRNDFTSSVAFEPDGMIVVAGFTSNATDYDFAAVRYISSIENIGVIDFHNWGNSVILYPNPISETAILGYTLSESDKITISLIDMQGRIPTTYLNGENQVAGTYKQTIILPEGLPSGNYMITISSPKGKVSIKIVN